MSRGMNFRRRGGCLKRDVLVGIVVEGSVVRGIIGGLVDEDVDDRLLVGLQDSLVERFQEVEGGKRLVR